MYNEPIQLFFLQLFMTMYEIKYIFIIFNVVFFFGNWQLSRIL